MMTNLSAALSIPANSRPATVNRATCSRGAIPSCGAAPFEALSLARICRAFWEGLTTSEESLAAQTQASAEKELRESLSEKEIDTMIEDSFPASDPPSTY